MVIQVLNLKDGATIDYSLAFLKAQLIPPCACGVVSAANLATGAAQAWPTNGSVLKCFVPLQPGANHLRLQCRHNQADLSLNFAPSGRRHRVRLLYLRARDSDGSFQAPQGQDCSPAAASRRIRLAALVLQALTAELLAEAGLPRRTFQFVTTCDLQPDVQEFECSFGLQEALQLPGRELWPRVAKELASAFGHEMAEVKWLGFMAFTRYSCKHSPLPRGHEEVMERTRGHCALGGGGLALFGSGNFYAWADSLEALPEHLSNPRKVDRRVLMDDSAFRGTFWSNYSTGLGAVLHELGHTFDLAHTENGIMQRGGDDINLALAYPPKAAAPCEQCSGRLPVPQAANGVIGPPQETQRTPERYLQKDPAFVPLRALQMELRLPNASNGLHSTLSVPDAACSALMTPKLALEEPWQERKGGPWGHCLSAFHNGRATFARSSAVMLAFHRWFRDDEPSREEFCLRISRTELLADRGLRIVEFVADGVVRDHWEFLGTDPPTVVPLGTSVLRQMCPAVTHVVVVAQDDEGHVYKARVRIDQFGESPVLSPA